MHYIVVSLIILQMAKIPTANTLTKNVNPECYTMVTDATHAHESKCLLKSGQKMQKFAAVVGKLSK